MATRAGRSEQNQVARAWWPVAGLVLAIACTYANSLSSPFVLDDQAAIVTNADIRDLGQLARVLKPAAESPVAGRPIANLSFALNYRAGGLDVRGYRIVNLTIHIACALMVLLLCRRTLRLACMADEIRARATPFATSVALLWAVHPLGSEVVNYLSQRTESLMAVFFLLTIYAAIRANESRHGRWATTSVVACGLGMMSKESMVTAPLIVALYDRVFLFDSWKDAFTSRKRLYAGLAATWLALAALAAGAPRSGVAGFSSGVSVWTNLLNQAVVITDYLRLSVWPRDLVAFYGWHLPLTLGDVLPHALVILSLLALTLVALVRVPWLGFLGAWFFITLAPSSSIIPIATEVGAERRMYLPLVALIVIAVVGLYRVSTRVARVLPAHVAPVVVVASVTAIAAALAAGTFARNREYTSALTLAQTIVDRRPTGVAYHMLGEQLQLAGRHADAMEPFREAIRRGNSKAGFPLGIALFNGRQYLEAIERLDTFVKTSGRRLVPRWLEPPVPDVISARLFMGRGFLARSDGSRAAQQAETVLASYPGHVEARVLLGDARYEQQRWPDAVEAYRLYLAARPRDVPALINFGVASVATGAMDEAVGAFNRAASLEPGNERANRLLRMALRDRARGAP